MNIDDISKIVSQVHNLPEVGTIVFRGSKPFPEEFSHLLPTRESAIEIVVDQEGNLSMSEEVEEKLKGLLTDEDKIKD